MPRRVVPLALLSLLMLPAGVAPAQGTTADYERARSLQGVLRGGDTVLQDSLTPIWTADGSAFWYLNQLDPSNVRWCRVDAASGQQQDAFEHARFLEALGQVTGRKLRPDRSYGQITWIADDESGFRLEAFEKRWAYDIRQGTIAEVEHAAPNDRPNAQTTHPHTVPGQRAASRSSRQSPDKLWRAEISDRNVVLHQSDHLQNGPATWSLTNDAQPDHAYTDRFIWSADSTRLVVIKRKAGDDRRVTIVDSSPDDQTQPKTESYFYLKPGDQVPVERPCLFDITTKQPIAIDTALAPNPYQINNIRWRNDSSAFTYEYNPRGHQGYRLIEVDAKTGESRAVIDEPIKTFFCYSSKKFLHYLDDANEIIWMSERDGWNHLYLYDWQSGEVKRQITQGQWVVRKVDRVDEQARQIWFWACGIYPEQDPYHRHYCRVEVDTGEVTVLTGGDGDHTELTVSPDGKYLVTTWSRVDHPPVHELRDAQTGELIREIARADATKLLEAGWVAPERFVAKGRDGETDIYGYLIKPTNFDETKKYPVIEYIYAGPHDQHVEKRFYEYMRVMSLAELGFIVVRIDGMGTNWRSKAFHDVAWKNLGDAGFPDRIAWMKAAAVDRPWMDLSRVGIYGGSAGGQNAMRAVLDHADFYKAAAADCGCHDNRMDKIWWNEQWMGWPVDESYEKSSNVVDAHKLGGALLLTVGELDKNVDPASTMQVVDALIKADKDFELIVLPGMGHGAGSGRYGERRMWDFFVRELHGLKPRRE